MPALRLKRATSISASTARTARGVLTGGSLFLGVDSKLGPIYVAYGQSQGGHSAMYLYIGSSIEAFRP